MSGPPPDVAPNELWLRLTQLPRPSKTVDYPRLDPVTGEPIGKVILQVLSQQETDAAQLAAERHAREVFKDKPQENGIGYENVYKNAAAVEVLYRAVKCSDDPTRPFFPSPKQMRLQLTNDEIAVLLSMFLEVQGEMGPIVSKMGDEEMEAWVRRLVEGGSTYPLASLSSEARSELTMRMALRLYTFLTDISSPGSPPEEPTTNGASPDVPEAAQA